MTTATATLTIAALLLAAAAVLTLIGVAARRRARQIEAGSRLGQQALDAMPGAIFIVDGLRRGRPNLYVNAAYSTLTGFDVKEALAAGFDALAVFTDPDGVSALDTAAEGSASKRVQVRRRDGTTVPAQLELRGLPRVGSARYVVGLLEPLASGKRATDAEPRAPRDASQPGAQPDRDKDAFWSWLSHELRSPLNACVMWVDVVALSPQPDKLAKAVDAIKRNLARQARLIADLSDAAKVSSGSLELRFEPLDLVALVQRELAAWDALAGAKQLRFQHRFELDAAPVVGDPARLIQTLNHVVESAIGSTASGGRVDLRVHAANGNCVVEVTDTGAALSPEDAAHLAVPLWRASSTTRARAGVGLGLAVAHHLVGKHGGTLTATSADSGARFVLSVPLATSDPSAAAVAKMDRTSNL
ncbi:MAG TPA: ATP-binding protein [Gammaproteobacteria bacterium]|nr:ATP-binding protein [Gammaproteobacteria bacterium]